MYFSLQEDLLTAISKHLDNNSTKSDAFLIDVSGTSLVVDKVDEVRDWCCLDIFMS